MRELAAIAKPTNKTIILGNAPLFPVNKFKLKST